MAPHFPQKKQGIIFSAPKGDSPQIALLAEQQQSLLLLRPEQGSCHLFYNPGTYFSFWSLWDGSQQAVNFMEEGINLLLLRLL